MGEGGGGEEKGISLLQLSPFPQKRLILGLTINVLRDSSRVPAPRWGGLRDEPKEHIRRRLARSAFPRLRL